VVAALSGCSIRLEGFVDRCGSIMVSTAGQITASQFQIKSALGCYRPKTVCGIAAGIAIAAQSCRRRLVTSETRFVAAPVSPAFTTSAVWFVNDRWNENRRVNKPADGGSVVPR
jgi:hypothetical protein